MAIKRDKNVMNEEDQKFSSKYLSDTVNNMVRNITAATKLPPDAFKHLADNEEDIEYISLGLSDLDKGLKGGLPRKTVVEIYGPPGGGKSFLACYQAAAAVTRKYGNVWIYDVENAFNRERAEDLGVATNRVIINNIYETGEQVLSAVCEQLYNPNYKKAGQCQPRWADLIIIDSIAALGSRNEMDADFVGDIEGFNEKMGPKQMPASRARMISSFQGRLNKSINNSSGIWSEIMPGSFLPDNSLYSFLPEDNDLPETLLADIEEMLKIRHTVIDPKNPDLWKAVYYAQNRRDRLNKGVQELTSKIGEEEALKLASLIENKNEKEYIKLKSLLEDSYNCNKEIMRVDRIMTELLKGKNILPDTSQAIKDFEMITNGYIYDHPSNKGLPIVHYNPGPTMIIINQVRVGNIGSFTGTTIERPGGYAFKHAAGTVLYVTPMTSKSKGEVKSTDGQTVAGWKSNVLIEKSRFTIPKTVYEIIIPFTQQKIDVFSEFMSDCQKMELWDYLRKSYVLPRDGSIIKTKDEVEWKELLLEKGLEYLQKQVNYSDEAMLPIFEALEAQLAAIEEDPSLTNDTEEDEY